MPNSAVVLSKEWDYTPSGQNPDTSLDLYNAIQAYSPWGHWVCHDASGSPLDYSGNNRHGHVSSGAPLYNRTAITPNALPSMQLENSRLGFPSPIAHLSSGTATWTIGGLFNFEAEIGSGSPAQSANGSPFIHQSASGYLSNSDLLVAYQRMYGENLIVRCNGHVSGAMNVMKLSVPMMIFVKGCTTPGAFWRFETWINGVLMSTGPVMLNVTAPTASYFHVGRNVDAAAPFAKFKVSNICCWSGELSPRQMVDITEFAFDGAAYTLAASAWNP